MATFNSKLSALLITLTVNVQLFAGCCLPAQAQDAAQIRTHYQNVIRSFEQDLAKARQDRQRYQELNVLYEVGVAYTFFGDYQKALERQQQALAIARIIGDHTWEEMMLRQLGTTYSRLGDDMGIAFYRQQLKLVTQQGDRQSQVSVLNLLGYAYLILHNNVAAIEVFSQSLRLVQAMGNRQQTVPILLALSGAYGGVGDREKQQTLLEQVLAIYRDLNDSGGQVAMLQTIGNLNAAWGDTQKGIDYYQNALQLVQQGGKPLEPYQFSILLELARLNAQLNRVSDTFNYLEKNRELARTHSQNIPLQVESLIDLGHAYFLQHNYERAIDNYTQGLQVLQSDHQQSVLSSTLKIQILTNLGQAYISSGELVKAESLLRSAIQTYTTVRQESLQYAKANIRSQDEQNIGLNDAILDTYQLLQQVLAVKQPEVALEVAEASRARAFAALLAHRLGVSSAEEPAVAAPTLQELQQTAISSQSTLVEYSILYEDSHIARVRFGNGQPQPIKLLIWVIQPTGKIALRQVDLAPLLQQNLSLETLVTQARDIIGARGRGLAVAIRDRTAVTKGPIRPLLQLHQLLIDPVKDLLPANPDAHVVFIPQGRLFLVPFAALQNASGNYLIEAHTISASPSIQVFQLTQNLKQKVASAQLNSKNSTDFLVVGNPTMPRLQLNPNMPPEQLPALPGAEQEAIAIAQLFHTTALIGDRATEATVVAQMTNARIVHLATHGLLDDLVGAQSSLAFAPTKSSNAKSPDGANTQTLEANDGFLRAREIVKLKLKAELVVLSACDTGRGTISGDGVIGLSRAFIGAGVPSVIVSLWSIPDAPTAFLMTQFYQMSQHVDKAQALRQAMLVTLKRYPNPSAWAAFVLIGAA